MTNTVQARQFPFRGIAKCLFLSSLPLAQVNYRAQIRGVVTDTSGAVLPNASVTVTETATGVSYAVTTDSVGYYYLVRALQPSNYTVRVRASGFQTIEEKGVVLPVDQQTSLNFTRKPASNEYGFPLGGPIKKEKHSSLSTWNGAWKSSPPAPSKALGRLTSSRSDSVTLDYPNQQSFTDLLSRRSTTRKQSNIKDNERNDTLTN